jgi:hypothetical protein
VGNISAQGTISFEDFTNISGNTYSVVVNYTNDSDATQPSSIDIQIKVNGAASSVSVQQAQGGWAASYNSTSSTARFNGGVAPSPGGSWNSSPGATTKIGTIIFNIANSGCVSLVSTTASFLIAPSHPVFFLLPPVVNSDYACKAAGKIDLAAGTSPLRTRLLNLIAPGSPNSFAVTSGSDFSFPLVQVAHGTNPVASISVIPDSYDEYNDNLNIFDMNLMQDYILGRVSLQPFQIVASDINKDSYVDIFDITGLARVILGTNTPSDMPQPWAYPTSPSLPSISFPVSYAETYEFSDIEQLTSLDFTAIKLGDVSIDDPDYDKSLEKTRFIRMGNTSIKSGETVNLPVFVQDLDKIELLSMSLGFDQDKVALISLERAALPVEAEDNFVVNQDNGTLNLIWSSLASPIESTDNSPAFYIKLRANQNIPNLAELFSLITDRTTNTAYLSPPAKVTGSKVTIVNLALSWEEKVQKASPGSFVKMNSQNPIQEEVRLLIGSKAAQRANIQLFDINGRQVYSSVLNLNVGDTPVNINTTAINIARGTYTLRISDDSGRKHVIKLFK